MTISDATDAVANIIPLVVVTKLATNTIGGYRSNARRKKGRSKGIFDF